jgi:CMP/dCMP kinase
MTVITISRQFGSGGDEIAQQLGQAIGYQLFNKQMVIEAAQAAGLTEADFVDYSEENHRVRGLLDRLFESTPVLPYTGIWPDDLAAMYSVEEMRVRESNSLIFIQKIILSAYEKGKIIIVGRGGQVMLKDRPGAVHVRIIAPLEVRVERIKARLRAGSQPLSAEMDQHLTTQARDMVHQRDAISADYIKRFYQADWTDPLLYHLVLNTGRISIPQAVQEIAGFLSIFTQETA